MTDEFVTIRDYRESADETDDAAFARAAADTAKGGANEGKCIRFTPGDGIITLSSNFR